MKKIIAVFLLISLLAGCSVGTEATPVTENLSFNTRVHYYNETYEAAALIDAQGNMTFDITSPEDIKGLRLEFTGDELKATFEGLEYTEKNPQLTGAFGEINKIFNDIRNNNKQVRADDDSYFVEGAVGGCEYDLTVSPAGLPIELESDCGDLEMSFLNIKIIE